MEKPPTWNAAFVNAASGVMGEHDGFLANIGYYEDLLRASPQDPRRPIIERLLAKEHQRLRERADPDPCALQLRAAATERFTLSDDDLEEGQGQTQRVNNASRTRHRFYGSLVGIFMHSP